MINKIIKEGYCLGRKKWVMLFKTSKHNFEENYFIRNKTYFFISDGQR